MCFFSPTLMRVNKLSIYSKTDNYLECINAINTIRGYYPWSKKTYDKNNIDNVYLISCNNVTFGFIDCELKETDFSLNNEIYIFLNEIHVTPKMQNKGVGKAVIEHLLSKGVNLEMIVANENTNMFNLLKKFNSKELHKSKDVSTMVVRLNA